MTKTKLFFLLRTAALSGCIGMAMIMAIVGTKLNLHLSDYVFPTIVALILFLLNLLLIPVSKNAVTFNSSH